MVPTLTRIAVLAAICGLSSAAFAQEYASAYTTEQGAVAPPKNLRITKGLPPMTELVGQIIQVNSAARQILVRDRANQLHRFIVPPYATLTANANLHQDGAALVACLNRQVRIRYISNIPAPDRFKAIDIFPAG